MSDPRSGATRARTDWARLLSPARAAGRRDAADQPRSAWQRDFDRIVYTPSFRRLADKTQVFPLPLDDHVHSRLTHSLEVSTVGRSLGTLVGRRLGERGRLPAGIEPRDVGDCVAAACLAHDLGNPPFGHVGEKAIQEFFAGHAGAPWFAALSPREQQDLLRFEGNAQGFRLAAHVARPSSPYGLDLAGATLGALVKYPCASDAVDPSAGASRRKHGVHAAEDERFAEVAAATGLAARGDARAWMRHPLAFLTEAADDIAYVVIDLEDGLRLRLVPPDQFMDVLRPLVAPRSFPDGLPARMPAGREERFELAGRMRTAVVDRLVGEVVDAFMAREEELLDGTFDGALVQVIPGAAALGVVRDTDIRLCYEARDVLKMELSGSVAIHGVLAALVDAALDLERSGGPKRARIRSRHLHRTYLALDPERPLYERLLRITDFVSGMTDNYVIRLFRELSGIRLPGGRD